jgi:hypothetical protein
MQIIYGLLKDAGDSSLYLSPLPFLLVEQYGDI